MARGARYLDVLRSLPREVWLACLYHVFDAYASFVISLNLTIYLVTEFHLSDVQAGLYYGIWGVLSVAFGIPAGIYIDRIGLERSLWIGTSVSFLGRLVFAFSDNLYLTLASLFLCVTSGSALLDPAIHIVVDRYSGSEEAKTFAFGVLYASMNFGALCAALLTDRLKDVIWLLSGYKLLFASGVLATVSSLPLVFAYINSQHRKAHQVCDHSDASEESEEEQSKNPLKESAFWHLLAITVIMLPVRAMFRYADTLLPLYLTRIYEDAPYGSLIAINPSLIIPLSILFGFATKRFTNVYLMLVVGTLISALSALILFVFYNTSNYWNIVAFFVVFTIGEAIYSPKTYQYILARSPKGKKGIYGALIQIPTFAGSILSGVYSGFLLENYCPSAEETTRCNQIGIWVMVSALATPLLLLAGYRFFNTSYVVLEEETEGIELDSSESLETIVKTAYSPATSDEQFDQ